MIVRERSEPKRLRETTACSSSWLIGGLESSGFRARVVVMGGIHRVPPGRLGLVVNFGPVTRLKFDGRMMIIPTGGFGFVRESVCALVTNSGVDPRVLIGEMSSEWLWFAVAAIDGQVRPAVRNFLDDRTTVPAGGLEGVDTQLLAVVAEIESAGNRASASWLHGRTLEILSRVVVDRGAGTETEPAGRRTAAIRSQRVKEILLQDVEHPPSLKELGRLVGCSSFYLSRTFKQECGMTISQFLQRARMEHAAELLRSGRFNVTEAAMTVGYSSLSHFSKTFADTFGCCPCLYGRTRL